MTGQHKIESDVSNHDVKNMEIQDCPYCKEVCMITFDLDGKMVFIEKKPFRFNCKVRICDQCFKNTLIEKFGEREGTTIYDAKLNSTNHDWLTPKEDTTLV